MYSLIIRIVQLVLALLTLGLVGHSVNYWTGGQYGVALSGYAGAIVQAEIAPASFVIFCCVWTFLVNGYLVGTTLWLPVAYNMWAQLSAEAVTVIFWLAGWASLASYVSSKADYARSAVDFPEGTPDKYKTEGNKYFTAWATAASGAAFGAIIWVLFIVTFVTFCLSLHRHRNDPANANNRFGVAEKGQNHELNQVPPQQQQQYPQQTQTPAPYVQPTPPPQQWQQSPPPQQQY
jgi:hypothetical protein